MTDLAATRRARAERRAAPKLGRVFPSGQWPMYSSVEGLS